VVDDGGVARLVTHPVPDILGERPAVDHGPVFAVLVDEPVGVLDRVHRPELRTLLSRERRVRPDTALSLEAVHPLVEVTI
jgi:hypothetical protein